MSYRANRVEQLLRHWEDLCLFQRTELVCRVVATKRLEAPMDGPFMYALDLRKELARATSEPFDRKRFLGNPDHGRSYYEYLYGLYEVPEMVWNWMACGRRIYKLDEELQFNLEHTSLVRMTWRDIKWPFPSFGIELATPIEEDGVPCDFILVTVKDDDNGSGGEFTLTLIPEQLGDANLRPRERRFLRRLSQKALPMLNEYTKDYVGKKQIGLNTRLLPTLNEIRASGSERSRIATKISSGCVQTGSLKDGGLDNLITVRVKDNLETAHVIGDTRVAAMQKAQDLVLNLVLLIRSFGERANDPSLWSPETDAKREKGEGITDYRAVFDLSRVDTLRQNDSTGADPRPSRAELEEQVRPSGRSVSPHFRSGYWRRRKGFGHIPDAEKIEHVRWTIVNAKDLEDGELPHGALSKLKS